MAKSYLFHPETWVALESDDSTDPPTQTLYYDGRALPKTDEFPIPWGPELWPWTTVSEKFFREIPEMMRKRRIARAKRPVSEETPPPE